MHILYAVCAKLKKKKIGHQEVNEEKMWGNSHILCTNCKRASEKKPPTFQDKSSAMCREIFSEDDRPA